MSKEQGIECESDDCGDEWVHDEEDQAEDNPDDSPDGNDYDEYNSGDYFDTCRSQDNELAVTGEPENGRMDIEADASGDEHPDIEGDVKKDCKAEVADMESEVEDDDEDDFLNEPAFKSGKAEPFVVPITPNKDGIKGAVAKGKEKGKDNRKGKGKDKGKKKGNNDVNKLDEESEEELPLSKGKAWLKSSGKGGQIGSSGKKRKVVKEVSSDEEEKKEKEKEPPEKLALLEQKKKKARAKGMKTGHISSFNLEKGFGFVKCDDDGEQVFFHKRAMPDVAGVYGAYVGLPVAVTTKYDEWKEKTSVDKIKVLDDDWAELCAREAFGTKKGRIRWRWNGAWPAEFGFVQPDHGGKSVFCHWTSIGNLNGRRFVDDEMEVEFEIRMQPDGRTDVMWLNVIDERWMNPGEDSNKVSGEEASNENDTLPSKQDIEPAPQKEVSSEAAEPELPAGWQKMHSKSTGRVYYYHTATGTSQNECPAEKPASQARQQSGSAEQLPPNWTKMQSSRTGASYYYNSKTGASQNEVPMA